MSTIEEVVLLIHGIRDFAEWQDVVAAVLSDIPNVEVCPLKYGRFDAFRFWFPIWTRDAPVKNLLWRIRSARDRFSTAKMSVVAHSFGTYAIGKILRENPDIRLHRLILCGAILPSNFRWDQIQRSVETLIINDCGIKDIWPVLAQSTTFGYGPSGRFGFGTPGVRDRYHDFGHGGFFQEKFVCDFWLPWFRSGDFVKSQAPPPSGTRWHLLTLIQIKWLAILLCIFVMLASFATRATFFRQHWRPWSAVRLPAPVKQALPGDTGWIFSGYYNIDSNTWQGEPSVRLVTPHRKVENILCTRI
jgi:pimeloyl-ACP methyl ester carboxylesterase